MIKEENHIRRLYNERGKNDANSTTLANTLDKDIQTVFNSPEKFIMELLQNADDARKGDDDQCIDVAFQIVGQYLMFSHTGKHFDDQDVDAICDNAQQHLMQKKLNLNKTGYKGIGFKSVFVISECVYIISNQYCFRFDSQYSKWNHSSTSTTRYPWQIVPIWTLRSELPAVFKLDNSHVNFIFKIKPDRIRVVPQAITQLLQNPYIILFLRNIQQITININNKRQCIQLRKLDFSIFGRLIYVDQQVNSRWLIITKKQDISQHIHNQLQELKNHECPAKLKTATSLDIQFAIQLDSNHHVNYVKQSNLFCYLPTQVGCNLPFLVNTDFLLSADRMQLLSNIWNTYLFECIAEYHIESLKMMAEMETYRDDILILFTPKLKLEVNQSFMNAYNNKISTKLSYCTFIPSYLDPSRLLTWPDAITDDIDFFNTLPSIDKSYQQKIARYSLKDRQKLCNAFDISVLTERIQQYAAQSLADNTYEQLLTYMISTYAIEDIYLELIKANKRSYGRLRYYDSLSESKNNSCLGTKKFLLTIKNTLVSPIGAFLPLQSDSLLQQFLTSLDADFIHPKLMKIPNSKSWLNMIGVSNITDDALIRFIKQWLSKQGRKLAGVTRTDSLNIMRLLKNVSTILIEKEDDLKKLPLITKRGQLKPASTCYLPSTLSPTFDLEKLVKNDVDIVDDEAYSQDVPSRIKLRSILISLQVKKDISFYCGTFTIYSDASKIDYYDEFSQLIPSRIQSFKEYHYHMAYLPYMRCLKIPSYAKIFFKYLHRYEDEIIRGMTNFKVHARSNKHRYEHEMEHYLKFMLNREPCIYGMNGQLYRMKDVYIPSIIKKMDAKLKRFLPQMKFKFDNEMIRLSDQLMILLGARNELAYNDVIKLFDRITDDNNEEYYPIYNSLYKLISKATWTTSQNDQRQRCRLKLLASDGSRQPAASLYYFSNQHLRIRQHPNIFKSFADMTKEEELLICRYFGVQILQDADYVIHQKQLTSMFQGNKIKYLLKRIAITVTKSNLGQDMEQMYQEWITKYEKLQIMPVRELVLQVKLKVDMTFKADFIITADHCLYFEEELNLAEYIEVIGQYINLPPDQIKLLPHFTLMPDQVMTRYLQNHNYDVSAIAKLDTASVLKDDNDSNPNLTETVTLENLSSSDEYVSLNPIVSHDNYRHHKLSKSYFNDLTISSHNDDEPIGSLEGQVDFKPCLPDEAIKNDIQFIRYEGSFHSSSSSSDIVKSENILSNAFHLHSNDLTNALHIKDISREVYGKGNDQRDKKSSSHQWTGRWGEEFAYKYFIKYYEGKLNSITNKTQNQGSTQITGMDKKGNKRTIDITWLNCHQENNKPVDIQITKNGHQKWIEVKTTYKSKDLFVKISHMEWKCMCQYRKDYRLCCVYNAGMQGDAVPIIKLIKDPSSKFFNGTLTPSEIHFKL